MRYAVALIKPGYDANFAFIYEADELPTAGEQITIKAVGRDRETTGNAEQARVISVEDENPYPIVGQAI